VEKKIQNKIDDLIRMARASRPAYTAREEKTTVTGQDSLSKIITTKEEANIFLAELEAVIKMAKGK